MRVSCASVLRDAVADVECVGHDDGVRDALAVVLGEASGTLQVFFLLVCIKSRPQFRTACRRSVGRCQSEAQLRGVVVGRSVGRSQIHAQEYNIDD